jgi:hypothetical protein
MIINPVKHVHLGDLINVLQAHPQATEICYEGLCACGCGQNTVELLRQLAPLFSDNLKVNDFVPKNAIPVCPTWVQTLVNPTGTSSWRSTPYKKISNLPSDKGKHIACQFDYRSKNTPWFKGINDLSPILQAFGDKLINIGDKPINGIENQLKISVLEKLEIIATAKMYIGIDSGLSHLALMTNTGSYICHENKCPWFFYPKGVKFINVKIKEELNVLLRKNQILAL